MVSNIQQLSEKRKKWVEANRENGFEDGIKRLLTDLYPDNAHFIYELLQNAEDARASEVRFVLNDDSIEFEHNGDRLFSIEDVDSITSIGVSNKKDDPTSIGKFGVGFKAVFAYTNTPEIHSGKFHFRIRDLVVPETDNLVPFPCKLDKLCTLFVFPFDNPKKSKENARIEIERNLRQLNENTLLFLSNIRKIEYLFPNSTMGFLERSKKDENRIEIFVQHPENTKPISAIFLRFEKTVTIHDEHDKLKSCRIAVAFRIVENKIVPIEPGQVCIYFPAEKETSNLRFHLHAPFASTVARDSVRGCLATIKLRDHLANLIAESMTTIRDQGLLTVGFLATLPNDKDNLSPFYKPIQNSLIKAFKNENLTPMKQGGHAAASRIFKGLAQLSNLISDEELAKIKGKDFSPPIWVANPPQRNQREDNFLSTLDIQEWNTEDFIEFLKSQSNKVESWLSEKSDEWHQSLYTLLGEYLSSESSYAAKDRKKELIRLRIIRISDGTYSIGEKCFFPTDSVEYDKLMPRVAKGVYSSGKSEQQQKKAKEFLKEVGVREVGEGEEIEVILRERYSLESSCHRSFKLELEDLEHFIALVEKYPSKKELFKDYFIFKKIDEKYAKPNQIYLDSPFLQTGLSAYYDALGDETAPKALSLTYKDGRIELIKLGKFAEAVGANTKLPIAETTCSDNPEWRDYLSKVPGTRCTNLIDKDYNIKGLEKLLKSPSIELSVLVWQTMCGLDEKYLQATYQKNSKGGKRNTDSQLVHLLKSSVWIPQKGNSFVRPCDAVRDQLPKGFPFDEGQAWLKSVDFGTTAAKRSWEYGYRNSQAKNIGFTSVDEAEKMAELAKLLREYGVSPDELVLKYKRPNDQGRSTVLSESESEQKHQQEEAADQLANSFNFKKQFIAAFNRPNEKSNDERLELAQGTVSDPDRRREKEAEEHRDRVINEPDPAERRKTTERTILEGPDEQVRKTLEEWYGGRCQICNNDPFLQRNGKPFFIAKYIVERKHVRQVDNYANALCLCAEHFARYEHGAVEADDIENQVLSLKCQKEGGNTPLQVKFKLCDQECIITFNEKHIIALQELWNVSEPEE